jgi:hypothetical protein
MITENRVRIQILDSDNVFDPSVQLRNMKGRYFTKDFEEYIVLVAIREKPTSADVRVLDADGPLRAAYSRLREHLPWNLDLQLYHVCKLMDDEAHSKTARLSRHSRNIVPFGSYVIIIEHDIRIAGLLLIDAAKAERFRIQLGDRILHRAS